MEQIRLIGLVLLITAILLTLAAGVTQTTSIRLKRPSPRLPPVEGSADPSQSPAVSPPPVEFVTIPILWPLLAAGGMGLLLWFGTAPLQVAKPTRRKGRRRRK